MYIEFESEVAQSCPTLCNPRDCSPPGSSVHGIFQARTLEWVAISFSNIEFRHQQIWILIQLCLWLVACLWVEQNPHLIPSSHCAMGLLGGESGPRKNALGNSGKTVGVILTTPSLSSLPIATLLLSFLDLWL